MSSNTCEPVLAYKRLTAHDKDIGCRCNYSCHLVVTHVEVKPILVLSAHQEDTCGEDREENGNVDVGECVYLLLDSKCVECYKEDPCGNTVHETSFLITIIEDTLDTNGCEACNGGKQENSKGVHGGRVFVRYKLTSLINLKSVDSAVEKGVSSTSVVDQFVVTDVQPVLVQEVGSNDQDKVSDSTNLEGTKSEERISLIQVDAESFLEDLLVKVGETIAVSTSFGSTCLILSLGSKPQEHEDGDTNGPDKLGVEGQAGHGSGYQVSSAARYIGTGRDSLGRRFLGEESLLEGRVGTGGLLGNEGGWSKLGFSDARCGEEGEGSDGGEVDELHGYCMIINRNKSQRDR